jgi:hypothetical protein
MNNLYDNGYYFLGQCNKIKEYTKLCIEENNDDDMETFKELLKELEDEYSDTDILVINYDNPMGYTIQVFNNGDKVVW